jgi:hypothetical protein
MPPGQEAPDLLKEVPTEVGASSSKLATVPKGGKGKKGKAEEEAVAEEAIEETEEQKVDREKAEVKEKIDAMKSKIEQY